MIESKILESQASQILEPQAPQILEPQAPPDDDDLRPDRNTGQSDPWHGLDDFED